MNDTGRRWHRTGRGRLRDRVIACVMLMPFLLVGAATGILEATCPHHQPGADHHAAQVRPAGEDVHAGHRHATGDDSDDTGACHCPGLCTPGGMAGLSGVPTYAAVPVLPDGVHTTEPPEAGGFHPRWLPYLLPYANAPPVTQSTRWL